MEKVSVIIPTYNRFGYLMNTIKSVKEQTYSNLEIIVINDCSTQKEYYEYDFQDVIVIHLPENSKSKFGFACPGGYQRNFGMKIATGKYIAFCDDDDIWFPNKLELQIKEMIESECKMSCTDGLIGVGIFDIEKKYKAYNAEHFYDRLLGIFKEKNSDKLNNGFPKIWDKQFLEIHNCCICSSVVIEKELTDKVGDFIIERHTEDYEYWLRVLEYTNCVYVDKILMYYDLGHAGGMNYIK